METVVQDLEKKWGEIQDNALSQPSPGILHHQVFCWQAMSISKNFDRAYIFQGLDENKTIFQK